MKFEIPFDEKIFREQHKLHFDLAWDKNLKKNKKSIFFGFGFLILGFLILVGKNNLGFLFLAFGLFYILNFYNYYSHYQKRKKKYFNLIDVEVEKYLEVRTSSIWEFNENNFRYKDYKFEAIINWIAFKGFRLKNDCLFIYLDDDKLLSYIIGKEEIGKENFDRVIQLLNKKIKKRVSTI